MSSIQSPPCLHCSTCTGMFYKINTDTKDYKVGYWVCAECYHNLIIQRISRLIPTGMIKDLVMSEYLSLSEEDSFKIIQGVHPDYKFVEDSETSEGYSKLTGDHEYSFKIKRVSDNSVFSGIYTKAYDYLSGNTVILEIYEDYDLVVGEKDAF